MVKTIIAKGRLALLLAGTGALLAALPARADVKAGVDAWSRGDWAAAVKEWQAPAAAGDPDAQFNLGQAYKAGRGVPRDLARAEALFGAAAAQGHMQASDNYGLLLYQRGAQAQAIPYLQGAASRGDPRAQYYMGIAHFNGEHVAKDWVRAYALVSIAQQAGLEAAKRSLAEMDALVPLAQRQQAVALSGEITAEAEATRMRQMAALDLGRGSPPPVPGARRPPAPDAETAVTAPPPAALPAGSPRTAGADYARPAVPVAVTAPRPAAKPPAQAAAQAAKPAPKPAEVSRAAAATAPPPAPAKPGGPWRVQLGAFAVAANAEAQWNKVKGRAELAGHPRQLATGGGVTRLFAAGFASQDAAQAACNRLKAGGIACLVTRP